MSETLEAKFLPTHVGVAALVDSEDGYQLVALRVNKKEGAADQGDYIAPTGHVELTDESYSSGALREFAEEVSGSADSDLGIGTEELDELGAYVSLEGEIVKGMYTAVIDSDQVDTDYLEAEEGFSLEFVSRTSEGWDFEQEAEWAFDYDEVAEDAWDSVTG